MDDFEELSDNDLKRLQEELTQQFSDYLAGHDMGREVNKIFPALGALLNVFYDYEDDGRPIGKAPLEIDWDEAVRQAQTLYVACHLGKRVVGGDERSNGGGG